MVSLWLFGSGRQGNKHTVSYCRRILRVTPRSTYTNFSDPWDLYGKYTSPSTVLTSCVPPNESKYLRLRKLPNLLWWCLLFPGHYMSCLEFHGTLFPFHLTGSLDKSIFHAPRKKIKRNVIRSLAWHYGTFPRISLSLGQVVWDRGKIVCVPLQVCLHQHPIFDGWGCWLH